MTKRCIFHIPVYVNKNYPSGSHIRPLKMIDAFKNIGYDVDVVMGHAKERKEQIQLIKNNIKKGIKYDFLYSESSTMPTLLTEKHHLPIHPILDFEFLKFCRSNRIKIGLFYRDIYWVFADELETTSYFKRKISNYFYKYDLKKYNELVDILYLPSPRMANYIPLKMNIKIDELPPATDMVNIECRRKYDSNRELNIFYVGGISKLYNLEMLFRAVQELKFLKLTVCCRKTEWESNKKFYEKYLNDRINIIHKSGKELSTYYEKSDILNLFLEPHEYRSFAMPVKFFEYLGYAKPILSNKGTAYGDFIEKYDIGWCINYDFNELVNKLTEIYENNQQITAKIDNIKKIASEHTWEARAKKVANQLINL